jgi:hypothetical protein
MNRLVDAAKRSFINYLIAQNTLSTASLVCKFHDVQIKGGDTIEI